VADEDLQEEAVPLRLGQRVDALALDRVLGGQHQEGRRDGVGHAGDRDVALGHHLEQGGLDLGRGAVDLVGQHHVGEHGPELDVEGLLRGPVDAGADEVGGNEVGGELEAAEAAAQDAGHRLGGQGLGQAGGALEQAVAAGQPGHEEALEHVVLADHHPLGLEERLLEDLFGGGGGLGLGVAVGGHVGLLGSVGRGHR
jgi:hypothetical protein